MVKKLKDFLIQLGCVYTIVSVTGAIANVIGGTQTNNFNVFLMFATCAIATFVLNLHNMFDSVSPLVMIILQYLIACVLCAIMIFVISIIYEPISLRGVFEYYRSFTIPYIILAGYYYYSVFSETKKQDILIKEIQENKQKEF
ncbi:MAG: hypothetical protein K6B41_08385 [Butyrivibrio sp.]|nr:hypothetical protein [Butyrivibrio sp.]